MILPLLASDAIVPAFQTPAPPAPRAKDAVTAVSADDRAAVAQRRDRPGVRHARAAWPARVGRRRCRRVRRGSSRMLVSVVIVPEFAIPAPPAPPEKAAAAAVRR